MHTLRGVEQRVWVAATGAGNAVLVSRQPSDAANSRTTEFVLEPTSPESVNYSNGAIAPDWHNRRIYVTYLDFTGTTATVLKWWDGKASGSPLSIGTPVATFAGYLVDSLAADPDNEHIYFTGHSDPYPDWTADPDYSVDLQRIDYDGTNLTLLDTIPVFRTGVSGATIGDPGVGSMIIHRREQRLYYVKRDNLTTATVDENEIGIYYRELGDITTEHEIYKVTCYSASSAVTDITLINCLSFDVVNGKIYWCEHHRDSGGRNVGNVKRADLDGSNLENLYSSVDPYAISFARYSNQTLKIYHEDFDRIATPPRDGYYLRAADFSLIEQLGKSSVAEVTGSPYPSPRSSYLWCGFESTGSGVKP